MSNQQVTVTIRILDREYQIACPDEGRDALLDSARYLNQRMRSIRNRGKALGVERIAVMASLNMARELLDSRRGQAEAGRYDEATSARMRKLCERIDGELDELQHAGG